MEKEKKKYGWLKSIDVGQMFVAASIFFFFFSLQKQKKKKKKEKRRKLFLFHER